jgi:hypothetical protein
MSVTGQPEQSGLIDLVKAKVKDTAGKLTDPDDYNQSITEALRRYSKHRPRVTAEDITGNGTHEYNLPTGWEEGFSVVKEIEYPVGDTPRTLIDDDDWEIYDTPTGKYLRLLSAAPETTETFRVRFTLLHTETTVPDADIDAVACLAGALCCEMLANAYAQTGDPTIGADSVNYRTKAQEFAARAKRLRELYLSHLGIKEIDTAPPASVTKDMDRGYPWGGDRLTHPRRWR